MLSCVWDTVDNWATLGGQDPELYLSYLGQGGTTYFIVCANGTVYMNETLFTAIQGA